MFWINVLPTRAAQITPSIYTVINDCSKIDIQVKTSPCKFNTKTIVHTVYNRERRAESRLFKVMSTDTTIANIRLSGHDNTQINTITMNIHQKILK